MKKTAIVLGSVLSVMTGFSAGDVVITIPSGVEVALDAAIAAGYLTGAADYTELLAADSLTKAGDGLLEIDKDLKTDGFDGDIVISAGVLRITVNGALGTAVGATTVEGGASLWVCSRTAAKNTLAFTTERLFIAGTGFDGKGAIVAKPNAAGATVFEERNGCFGGIDITLTANALVASENNANVDFPYNGADGKMTFAGHTLTLASHYQMMPIRINAQDDGHLVVTKGKVSINAYNKFPSTTTGTITFRDGGFAEFFNNLSGSNFTWDMIIEADAGNGSHNLLYDQKGGAWNGPITLNASLMANCWPNDNKNPDLTFNGKISGIGGVSSWRGRPAEVYSGTVHLNNGENDFDGAVSMVDDVGIEIGADGAVPPDCAGLFITNAPFSVASSVTSLTLPEMVYFTDADREMPVPAGGYNWTKPFVKDGPGALTYGSDSPFSNLKIASGSVKIPSVNPVAGLYEGTKIYDSWSSGTDPGNNGQEGYYGSKTMTNETNNVRLSPYLATPAGAKERTTGKCTGATYSGYFYVPEAGTYTFLVSVNYFGSFNIDSVSFNSSTKGAKDEAKTWTKSGLSAGWHLVGFRLTDIGNACGIGPNAAGHPDCGFAYKIGGASDDVNDYTPMIDPGDGSMFVRYLPDSAEYAALVAAPRRIADRIEAAPGTSLDCGHLAVEAGDVVGPLAVVNTGAFTAGPETFTVTGDLSLEPEDLVAGRILTSDGAVAFAPGSTISVPSDSGLIPFGASYPVVTAAKGITGLPELSEVSKNGALVLSADGKTLSMIPRRAGMIFFVM